MFNLKLRIQICTTDNDFRDALLSVEPDEGYPYVFLPVQKQVKPSEIMGADIVICDVPLVDIPQKLPHRSADGAPFLVFAEHIPDEVESFGRLKEFEDIWVMPASRNRMAYRLHRMVRFAMARRDHAISRDTFRLAMDSVPDLFWMKDNEGRHYNVNNAFCSLVRKSKEQCEGRGHYYIWDIEPDEYAKGEFVCLESEETVVKARRTCLFDEKIIGPDGNKMQFQTYKTPIFDVDGTIIGSFGIARDVTNWKNQATELSIIINSLDNAALIVDANDKIVVANTVAANLFGQQRSEMIGASYKEWRTATLHYGREIAPGEHVQLEYEGERCTRNLEVAEEPIFDVFNQQVGRFVRFLDVTEHMEHIGLLMNYKKQLEADVKLKTKTIQEMQRKFLISFSDLISSRDLSSGSHIKNTCLFVELLLDQLRQDTSLTALQDKEYCDDVRRAVPLHDIGKISIPDAILNKRERYTEEEYAIRQDHTKLGGRILAKTLAHIESFKYFKIAWNMAVYHHEAWDGSGYPSGLVGEAIPLEARIMAVADAFDRMLTDKPYRRGCTIDEAFARIKENAGIKYDPLVARAMQECQPAIENFLREQRGGK